LVELHVFYVPEEVWNFKLNTVPVALASKFISAGFIRVSPHITLRMLREKLGEYLGGVAVADKFQFLKCIGKKLAVVKAKQEAELELKSFAPPYALYPELYLLPQVEYFEDVYPLSSSTQQRHHFNAETNRSKWIQGIFLHTKSFKSCRTRDWKKLYSTKELPAKPSKGGSKRASSPYKPHFIPLIFSCFFDFIFRLLQYRASKSVTVLGENLDDQANKNKHSDPTCPKEYTAPPTPPLLALSINPAQVPAAQAEKNKIVEQLEQMKKDRRHMEKTREELVKKVKTLLEQNKLRRYHAREEWKKKYFETKKATVSLEDVLSKLQQDLELYHQKLLLQLEARDSRKQPKNTTDLKNNRIIQITTVQHELDRLRRKLDDTKMKLVIEIKMRKQAIADLRALRAELTQKKIHSALILQSGKSGI
ncbi:SPAT1 protein, partial [Odontophorus gujanensis]|nr:SPAT1 protein [Odontophorus gujanensis]